MMTLQLALRNLLRNRRRSLATLLALAIGSAAILLFGGYSANIRYTMLSSYVRTGGHVQIQHRDFLLYGGGNPTAYGIADYERIRQGIRDDPVLGRMVAVATPMLQFGGLAGNYDAGVSRTIVGAGFVADEVNRMRRWNEYGIALEPPEFKLVGTDRDAAVIGVGLARVLLLCERLGLSDCPRPAEDDKPKGPALPADVAALAAATATPTPAQTANAARTGRAKLELLASHGRGSPNVAALSVVAAEPQGFKELDEAAVILHLAQAQQVVYGRTTPRVTSIMLQLQRTAQIPEATRRLEELLPQLAPTQPLAVHDFRTLNPFYVQTMQLFDTIFGFIFALIGGIVLFTIGNTMTAAVVERTVEIGTVRAIGVRQGGIRRLFIAEGLILGCVGALIGVVAALLVSFVVNALDLTWLPPGSTYALPLKLMIWGETFMIVGTTLGLIAIAVASAWLPARRAARLKIVDALRHV